MSSFFPVSGFYDTYGSIDTSTGKRKNRADEQSPQEIRRPQLSQHQRPAKRHKVQGSAIIELAQIRRQREQLRRRREKHDERRRAKIRPYTDWYTDFQQAVFADATAKMAADIAAWEEANEYESKGKYRDEGEGGDGSEYEPFSDREGCDEVDDVEASYEGRARDMKRVGEEALKDSGPTLAPTDENATVKDPLPPSPKNADGALCKIAMHKSRAAALKNTSFSAYPLVPQEPLVMMSDYKDIPLGIFDKAMRSALNDYNLAIKKNPRRKVALAERATKLHADPQEQSAVEHGANQPRLHHAIQWDFDEERFDELHEASKKENSPEQLVAMAANVNGPRSEWRLIFWAIKLKEVSERPLHDEA